MTPEEATAKMREIATDPDAEVAHCAADGLMGEVLCALGYQEMWGAFVAMDKWYA